MDKRKEAELVRALHKPTKAKGDGKTVIQDPRVLTKRKTSLGANISTALFGRRTISPLSTPKSALPSSTISYANTIADTTG